MSNETAVQPVENKEVGAMALITLQPEQYAAEIYQPFKTRLAAAIEAARRIDYDITTGKGMEVVKKARRMMMDIRIDANKQREERKAPIIKIGKLLESNYKAVEELVLPLETFFDGEIEAEEQRKEAEKQAKITAERVRIEAIQARIKQFSDIVLQAAGQGSAAIEGLQERLAEIEITEVDFEEFIPQATEAKSASVSALEVAHEAAKASEEAIEAARIKREEEDRQRAAEAAENARVKAENDRVAAEQAKEAKRLADLAEVQRNELMRAQQEADERIKAAAAVEAARIQAEADKRAKEHADAMQALADQRAEFEAQQQAVAKVKAEADKKLNDEARLQADHGEALLMDAMHDAEVKMASKVDSMAVAEAMIVDAISDPEEPTDGEIITAYVDAFGGSMAHAVERLRRFNT